MKPFKKIRPRNRLFLAGVQTVHDFLALGEEIKKSYCGG